MAKLVKISMFCLTLSLFVGAVPVDVFALGHISDRVSTSWPGTFSDHYITFQNTKPVPPLGRIEIIPQSGAFQIFNLFATRDVDLATSSAYDGIYQQRDLAALPTITEDGVAVIASTSNDMIAITLNSTYGIDAAAWVKIDLGIGANWQATGSSQIFNPIIPGSYSVEVNTYGSDGTFISRGATMISVIEPVKMTAHQEKYRFNGAPFGIIAYGTANTIMSLNTNYASICRYGIATGTPYTDLPYQFSYTGAYYHSILLTGLTNGRSYTYFIRCRDTDNIDDDTDFIITFRIPGQADQGGTEDGTSGPGGGGSGGGGGGGLGNTTGRGQGEFLPYPLPPGSPSISLQGYAHPGSETHMLKDGKEEKKLTAGTDSKFKFDLFELKQGVYTFSIWAFDKDKRKSVIQAYTIYLKEGTQSQVNNIFIPPTIQVKTQTIDPGQRVEAFGYVYPGSSVEVWLYPKKTALKDNEIVKTTVIADSSGYWSSSISTTGLAEGQYKIKAKASATAVGNSDFSQTLDLGIGVDAGISICAGADLNKDGKVNLFDFSILLYYWGTNNECADQNKDGRVDLTDFSIMMYYWTG